MSYTLVVMCVCICVCVRVSYYNRYMCISKCLCVYLLCLYVVVFNNTHDERIYIPRRMPSHDVCVCVFRITIGICVYQNVRMCVYLLCV